MTQTLEIDRIQIRPYHIPFEHKLITATTNTKIRHGWWLVIHTKNNIQGIGDIAPWNGFGSGFLHTKKTLQKLKTTSLKKLPTPSAPFQGVENILTSCPEVQFGWEMAILDIWSQQKDCSLSFLFNERPKQSIVISQLVTSVEQARKAKLNGISAFKVKVGAQSIEDDIAHIQTIRKAIGEEAILCADANGKWSTPQALDHLQRLQPYNLSFVEQPIPPGKIDDLMLLKKQQSIPIAIDEGIVDLNSLHQHIQANAIDVAILKPMFLGGFSKTREIANAAQKANIPVCVTTSLESHVGRMATAHFCAATKSISLPFGLGTPLQEKETSSNQIYNGKLYLPTKPGFELPKSQETIIPNPLAAANRSKPNHIALVFEQQSITYRQLTQQVATLANQLSDQVQPGSLIVLLGKPSQKWLVYWHALGWLGAIVAPINPQAKPHEVNTYMEQLQPDGIVTCEPTKDIPADYLLIQPDDTKKGIISEVPWFLNDIRTIIFSSGSTGTPKAIPLRVSQLLFAAMGSALRLQHLQSDTWLCCLPLHHIGGLSILLRCTWYATTVVLHLKFIPDEIIRSMQRHQVSHISLVPTMLSKLLDNPKNTKKQNPFPPSTRVVLLGGAAASQQLIEQSKQLSIPIHLTWGMTESAAQIATTLTDDPLHPQCVGPPLPFAMIYQNQQTLVIHSPQTGPQPYQTNDMGKIDDLGRIWLAGRTDKAINTGGKLVDPKEVKQILLQHPAITEALVLGIPDPKWGEMVVAALIPKSKRKTPTEKQIQDFCKSDLSAYKVPKKIIFMGGFPQNQMGKLKWNEIYLAFSQHKKT